MAWYLVNSAVAGGSNLIPVWYGTTSADVSAHSMAATGLHIVNGSVIGILFSTTQGTSTTNMTLTLTGTNDTAAKGLFYNGTQLTRTSIKNYITNTQITLWQYDGTRWNLLNPVVSGGNSASLNRIITVDDNSANTSVADTGVAITLPLAVTVGATSASSTQNTTTTVQSLRTFLKSIRDNIAHLFANKIDTLTAGTNITITGSGTSRTINASGGGASGNYLPITGGTLTGNLRLQTGSSNYGSRLNFGDGQYAYIEEPTDDALNIYATNGITINRLSLNNPLPISSGGTGGSSAWNAMADLFFNQFGSVHELIGFQTSDFTLRKESAVNFISRNNIMRVSASVSLQDTASNNSLAKLIRWKTTKVNQTLTIYSSPYLEGEIVQVRVEQSSMDNGARIKIMNNSGSVVSPDFVLGSCVSDKVVIVFSKGSSALEFAYWFNVSC